MKSFVDVTESAGVSESQMSHLKGVFLNYLILLEGREGGRKRKRQNREI